MAATFVEGARTPLGPGVILLTGTVTLNAAHAAGGDVVDLSSYFGTEVVGGWPIDETDGYEVVYHRAASGAVATGTARAYYGDYDNAADGPLVEATGVDLHLVSFEMAFIGY